MYKYTAVALQGKDNYDSCPIGTCFKKIFKGVAKKEETPKYIISKQIAEIKDELERLNNTSNIAMSYPYLAALEQSLPDAGFRYAVIYHNNAPIVFAYFQLFTLTSHNFSLHKDKSFIKGIVHFFLDLKKAKILVTGNALHNCGSGSYYSIDNGITQEQVTELVLSAAEKIAADECVSAIILKDLPITNNQKKELTNNGYHTPYQDNVMVLDLNQQWATLKDYVAALSRKYKTRANKIIDSAKQLVVKQLTEQEIILHNKAINKLFNEVTDSQQFKLTTINQHHFTELKKVYQQDFEVTGFFYKEQLVAFFTAFVTPQAYEIYYAGFDYQLNNDYQLYFNILFSGLERAIILQKKHLKLGRTSLDAKASLGAKPIPNNYYIKTPNIPQAVSKWFAKYFSSLEDGKWKLRHPMK